MPFLKGRSDPFEIQSNQRYDRMFELMDCHGEHVERPEEFRAALERALKAGRTALVDVVGDRAIGHPSLGGNLLGSTRISRVRHQMMVRFAERPSCPSPPPCRQSTNTRKRLRSRDA